MGSGTTVDQFGLYVRMRLDEWGREFALDRDCDYLGHHGKNMLQVLIEHRGEMPARPTGFKPLEVNQAALQMEVIVSHVAEHEVVRACCLRAYFCGSGRRGVERLDTAEELARAALQQRILLPKRTYFAEVELGITEVRGMLVGMTLAA